MVDYGISCTHIGFGAQRKGLAAAAEPLSAAAGVGWPFSFQFFLFYSSIISGFSSLTFASSACSNSSNTLNTNLAGHSACPPPSAIATAVASTISFLLAPKSAALLT
jgi:hypothetical protein